MSSKFKDEVEVSSLRPMLQHFNEELGRYINEKERFKLGRVLTIIEASFTDPEQRKAVKDLINDIWWGQSSYNYVGSNTTMVNPHVDIRGLALALGFELYPLEKGSVHPPESPERERLKARSAERYEQVAIKSSKPAIN